MTKNSPRIYIYKITFEEVQYYYYGVHKEKRFGEYYMGSPKTHKWAWKFYTPKKQILQFFEFSDAGYIEAQEVENRLIKPFYNTDKWCLNEACGGIISLEVCRQASKNVPKEQRSKAGQKCYELGVGIHALTKEERIQNSKNGGKKAGQKTYEKGNGVHGRTKEQMTEDGKKGAQKAKELGVGIYALTDEERIKNGKKAGQKCYELGIGIHSLTKEQRQENIKKTNSQVWECTVTGHRANPGNLSKFQKKRNIDTKNRRRIK